MSALTDAETATLDDAWWTGLVSAGINPEDLAARDVALDHLSGAVGRLVAARLAPFLALAERYETYAASALAEGDHRGSSGAAAIARDLRHLASPAPVAPDAPGTETEGGR